VELICYLLGRSPNDLKAHQSSLERAMQVMDTRRDPGAPDLLVQVEPRSATCASSTNSPWIASQSST
jgi:hypothetical protein